MQGTISQSQSSALLIAEEFDGVVGGYLGQTVCGRSSVRDRAITNG
jgi:hypothetical protein